MMSAGIFFSISFGNVRNLLQALSSESKIERDSYGPTPHAHLAHSPWFTNVFSKSSVNFR